MGFLVGNSCIDNRETAENIYFSSVSPVITKDGFHQLVYINGKWNLQITKSGTEEKFLQIKELRAALPQCSIVENFKSGQELGIALIPTAVVLFSAALLIKLMR